MDLFDEKSDICKKLVKSLQKHNIDYKKMIEIAESNINIEDPYIDMKLVHTLIENLRKCAYKYIKFEIHLEKNKYIYGKKPCSTSIDTYMNMEMRFNLCDSSPIFVMNYFSIRVQDFIKFYDKLKEENI